MTEYFKEGAKVRCVNNGPINGWDTPELTEGAVYTVKEQTSDTNVYVYMYSNEGDARGFWPQRFELVKEKPAAKDVKVGDKVRIIAGGKEGDNYHNFKHGSEVSVTGFSSAGSIKAVGMVYRYGDAPKSDCQFIRPEHFEVIPTLDLSEPVFTAEGTPVEIITTNGRDKKYPVLAYEGKATIPSKYTLDGKSKTGKARRHLTNVQAPEPAPREFYVNLYDGGKSVSGNYRVPDVGNWLYDSAEEARKAHNEWTSKDEAKHAGIAKVVLVEGRLPKSKLKS